MQDRLEINFAKMLGMLALRFESLLLLTNLLQNTTILSEMQGRCHWVVVTLI